MNIGSGLIVAPTKHFFTLHFVIISMDAYVAFIIVGTAVPRNGHCMLAIWLYWNPVQHSEWQIVKLRT